MGEINIRTVLKKDLVKVYEIEKQSFKDFYPLTFIDALYNWNPKTFLIAERVGEVLGYVIATTQTDIGHIVSIAVVPFERRKGIGRSLIITLLNVLKDLEMNSVRLEVRRSNIAAQRFYEALGFKYAHTANEYYGDESAFIYLKFL